MSLAWGILMAPTASPPAGPTRFYLPASGASTPADPGRDALWGGGLITGTHSHPGPVAPSGTAVATRSTSYNIASGVTHRLLGRWTSAPLAAQTITGTWTASVLCMANSGSAMSLQLVVRVTAGDTTTARGVVYAGHNVTTTTTQGALGQQFSLSPDARTRIIPGVAGSSVAAQAGDRICVELGYRADKTGSTITGYIDAGDPIAGSDYPLTAGDTTAGLRAWVETSQGLAFQ